jgi:putative protease
VRTAFEKHGDTRFELRSLELANPGGLFLPMSRLNEARRALMAEVEAAVGKVGEARIAAACAAEPPLAPVAVDGQTWSIKVDRVGALSALEPADFASLEEIVIDIGRDSPESQVEKIRAIADSSGRPIRLALPMIARAWEDKSLRNKVTRLREAGFNRWEAANVSAWSRLGDGVELASDWSIYVLNSQAARQVTEMGASRFTLSVEDGLGNMRALLAEFGARATVVVYQDTPLFVSESCPYATLRGGCPGVAECTYDQMELSSSYGGKVLAINERCRTFVVRNVPFSLSDRLEALKEADALRLRADFVHRAYAPAEVALILGKLRRGEPVPGHRANFDRGLAGE